MFLFIILFLKSSVPKLFMKGGVPNVISYINMANVHQSTDLPYLLLFKTSGAIYSAVPHKDLAHSS